MGLSKPPRIPADHQRRSFITVIKRNWHLLPYEQLLVLLDWTPEHLAFTLREDDFLFTKLGGLKPKCERLTFIPADEQTLRREREIANALILLRKPAATAAEVRDQKSEVRSQSVRSSVAEKQ